MTTTPTTPRRKLQRDIEVGDIIDFFGTPHRVDRIDAPSEATQAIFQGHCVGVARSNDGWGISLSDEDFSFIEVV